MKGDLEMGGRKVQFNWRSIIFLLVVVLMLVLSVTPVLAWFDEGDVNGHPAERCRLVSVGTGEYTVYCFDGKPHHNRAIVQHQAPLVHPAVLRAEIPFLAVPGTDDVLVQTGQ
jgi:hypothetical protein